MHAALKMAAAAFMLAACSTAAPEPQWVQLFNGRDLDGWTPKFAGHPLGENINDTFRVEDGLLTIDYSGYDQLDEQFGHLFYETPYSHYRIRVEYRFIGEQVAGAPAWALRNNGVMLHTQPPETMRIDQFFPDSIEVQLLGGDGVNARTTANLCTPQTSIIINGAREHEHCIISSSPTYHGDQWVTAEIEVRGGESIRHYVNGELVMEYSAPLLDEDVSWQRGRELTSGYIALQAESHPTQFRRVEILLLDE